MRTKSLRLGLLLGMTALAAGCTQPSRDDGAGVGGGSGTGDRIAVDGSLATNVATHPSFTPQSGERREAVVVGPNGNRYRFIERELLVATHGQAELDAMLARTGGTLLESWSFSKKGDASGLDYHAVRIDPSRIARADLDAALAALESAA